MSAITAKARRKMKKYAVLTREPRCFLGSFDFSWEQRKFEEIAVRSSVICSDDTLPRVEYEDIVSGTGRLNKDIYAKQSSKSGIAFHQGDVLYGKLRPYLQNWLLPTFDGLAVGDFWVLQPQNADSSFLYRLIQSRQFDEVANQSTGTKMPRADWKLVSKTVFSIPSNISEQAAIGTYFTALDSLITLHQRKCVFLFSFFRACISMNFTASTFSWEQRKLGELVDRVVRKNTNNESTLPLTISAQYGLVDQITYFNNRVASRDVSNYYLVLNGEFAYNKSTSDGYPFGAVKRLDLYEKGVLSTLYIVFTPKKEQQIDSDFLTVFFDTDRWHKGVAERAAEGARNHGLLNISAEDFFDIDLSVPKDIVEQKQIGAFIRQLDHLITLHQRECISFTGSAGRLILTANKKRTASSWEQRKLGDISEIKTGPFGSTLHADDYVSDGTPIITTEHFKTGALPRSKNGLPQVSDSDYKRLTAYTLDDGDIVFSRVGSVDINALITPFQSNWLFSGRVLRVRPQTDISSKFLHTRLETESIKTDIRTRAVGQTMPSINTEILKITPLVLPSSAAEQEQIGSYFAALDNLITLHQRKPFLMKWRTSDANRNQTNRLVL